MANKGSNIEELFREGLGNHEMPVRPELWNAIQASVGQSAVAGAAASSGSLAMTLTTAAIGVALTTIGLVGEVQYQNQGNETSPEAVIEHVATPAEEKPLMDTITKEQARQIIAEIEAQPEFTLSSSATSVVEEIESESTSEELPTEEQPSPSELVQPNLGKDEATTAEEVQPTSGSENEQIAEQQDAETPQESNKTAESEEPGTLEELQPQPEPKKEVESMVDLGIPDAEAIQIAPGKGGTHECFELPYMMNVSEFNIQIFDRNGRLLFTSDDPGFRWCGTDQRDQRIKGVQTVFYQIIAVDDAGILYKGNKAKSFITVYGD